VQPSFVVAFSIPAEPTVPAAIGAPEACAVTPSGIWSENGCPDIVAWQMNCVSPGPSPPTSQTTGVAP